MTRPSPVRPSSAVPRHLISSVSLTASIAVSLLGHASASAGQPVLTREGVLARHGVDPASPLIARVGPPPAAVLALFDGPGETPPTPHALTATERQRLADAFERLTPLHQRVLAGHLRTISFLDGMPNTALTSTVNPDEPVRLFDITIRAGVLRETGSEWMTSKERTLYDGGASRRSVSVEAGALDAIVYVLLHEATHVVDNVEGLTPSVSASGAPASPPSTAFTAGVWIDRTTAVAAYRQPLLEGLVYRQAGRALPIAQADALYAALRATPFASVYGSANWYDDLSELVALHHWTQVLRQPFRLVVRDGEALVASYEPMKSPQVRARFAHVERFYRPSP